MKQNFLSSSIRSMQKLILTITKYSSTYHDDSFHNETWIKQIQVDLEQQAKKELNEVVSISSTKLFDEHRKTWSSIWQSGFSISRSLAPSAMNGDVINRTLYYILSTTPAPLHASKIDENKRKQIQETLFHIDRCYESHSTL